MDAERAAPTSTLLFRRSLTTLVASWDYLASGSPGAAVHEVAGAAIAAFVRPPEREFLNNAVLAPGTVDPGAALAAIERTYGAAGIERYAIWVHETEAETVSELLARGYRFDTATRTMAMAISELAALDTAGLELVATDLEEFWRLAGVDGMVPELPAEGAHFYVARHDGASAATLMAFDHEGDCGIYMVGTLPAARRRGIATALSALAVAAAHERGCITASLQATAMAEGVYSRVGFRDLGRFEEYVPG